MCKYFQVGEISVPSYSMMIMLGAIVCNLIAQCIYRNEKQQYLNFLLLELLGGIGAILGARILSMIRLFEREGVFPLSLNDFSEAGYSYYGGLFGFFLFVYITAKVVNIKYYLYARECIFLLPLLHSFWKVGCFLGGCCFGVPYDGLGAVVFPKGVNCLSGINVFPVQILESIIALLIAICLIVLKKREKLCRPVSTYLLMYGMTRLAIEFLRYHDDGSVLFAGHIYSLICIVAGTIGVVIKRKAGAYG